MFYVGLATFSFVVFLFVMHGINIWTEKQRLVNVCFSLVSFVPNTLSEEGLCQFEI